VHREHSPEPARGRAGLSLLALALLSACQGPKLTIERPRAPDQDATCYVDGHRVTPPAAGKPVPHRPLPYYGTLDVDVVPAVRELEQFQRMPARTTVEVPEPVTPWVFPLDLAGELMLRWFTGQADHVVQPQAGPNQAPVLTGYGLGGLEGLRQRAYQARTWR
jgi:hypothetical protein